MDDVKKRIYQKSLSLILRQGISQLDESDISILNFLLNDLDTRIFLYSYIVESHPSFLLSQIFSLMINKFSHGFTIIGSESSQLCNAIFLSINNNIVQNSSKVTQNDMNLIYSGGQILSYFQNDFLEYLKNNPIPTNSNQVSLILITTYFLCDDSSFSVLIQNLLPPKFTYSPVSYAAIQVYQKHCSTTEKPSQPSPQIVDNSYFSTSFNLILEPPNIKNLISYAKSIPEELFNFEMPHILRLFEEIVTTQYLKEMPSFFSFLIKPYKKDSTSFSSFIHFLNFFLNFEESPPLLKSFSQDFIQLFILNAEQDAVSSSYCLFVENLDLSPFECINVFHEISSLPLHNVLFLANAATIKLPIESFHDLTFDSIKPLFPSFDSISSCYTMNEFSKDELLLDICTFCAFSLKIAPAVLPIVSALIQGSQKAYDVIVNEQNSFDLIYPELVAAFFPEIPQGIENRNKDNISLNPLFIQALEKVLKRRINETPTIAPPSFFLAPTTSLDVLSQTSHEESDISKESDNTELSSNKDTEESAIKSYPIEKQQKLNFNPSVRRNSGQNSFSFYTKSDKVIHSQNNLPLFSNEASETSCSEFETVYNKEASLSDSDKEEGPYSGTVPTNATIFFCKVIVNYETHSELHPLLPLASSSISNLFSNKLMLHLEMPVKHQDSGLSSMTNKLLTAYGQALLCLEDSTLYSLAESFLCLCPGQAMLFFAVSLQKLSHGIVEKMLIKVKHYASEDPELFGKMVALIAHSHPTSALSFISSLCESAIQRKSFFFFKSFETNERILSAIFRCIGYSSTFVNLSFFGKNFLPIATALLNKHLSHSVKSIDLLYSSLFAIRKLARRVYEYQTQNPDYLFAFKDFVVQYVCSLYYDIKFETNSPLLEGRKFSGDEQSFDIFIEFDKVSLLSSILRTLTSLLPVAPIRPAERYENAVEKSTSYLETDLFKEISSFFKTLLNVNQTTQSFLVISTSLFPNLLTSSNWTSVLELCYSLSSKAEKCFPEKGTDLTNSLSQILCSIGSFLVCILPILCTSQYKISDQKVTEETIRKHSLGIIYNLLTFQSVVQNSIIKLPTIIKPQKPHIDEFVSEDSMNAICIFLAKQLTLQQVFEVAEGLLGTISWVKPEHYEGAIKASFYILKEKGNEESCYDSSLLNQIVINETRIISELKDAKLDISQNVSIQYLEKIVSLLADLRLDSVLSNLISPQTSASDEVLMRLIDAIISKKTQLSVLQFFSKNVSVIPKQFITSNLFSSIDKQSDLIWGYLLLIALHFQDNSDRIKKYFGIEKVNDIANAILSKPDSILTILDAIDLSNLLELKITLELVSISDPVKILNSLSKQNIDNLFLMPLDYLESNDHDLLEVYFRFLKRIGYTKWENYEDKIISAFCLKICSENAKYASSIANEGGMNFMVKFSANIIKEAVQQFKSQNSQKFFSGFKEFLEKSFPPDISSLSDLIPYLWIFQKDKIIKEILSIISIHLNNTQSKKEILKNPIFFPNHDSFLKVFLDYIKDPEKSEFCVTGIETICLNTNTDNFENLSSLVNILDELDSNCQNSVLELLTTILA